MIKVHGKNILVRRIMRKPKPNAILIPGQNDMVDSGTAEVLYVGDEVTKVKVGDIVSYIFGFEGAVINGEKFLVGNENAIYATITDEENDYESVQEE